MTDRTPYEIATDEIGTMEVPGPGTNDRIGDYLRIVGQPNDDRVAWCSAFVNWCCASSGIMGTGSPAAISWEKWGDVVSELSAAIPGDIVIITRPGGEYWQRHVGFYVSHGDGFVRLLGGNQKDAVCFAEYATDRITAIRRVPPETR